jgi:hypothetical protein
MPRVVPSDVVSAAYRMFRPMIEAPTNFPSVGPHSVPGLVAFASLVDAVPAELVTLEPTSYAGLVASVAYLRALPEVFLASRQAVPLNLPGYAYNPIALIREAMTKCPDEAPAPGTNELAFITDPDLRASIRLDVGAANTNLTQGEWKGATVLSGSATEALLLWSLQEHERQKIGALAGALASLLGNKTLTKNPGHDPENWGLHEYVEMAAHLKLIKDETAKQVRLAIGFRNLIHPGRAVRLGQKCDHATALGALAAMHAVARDVAP